MLIPEPDERQRETEKRERERERERREGRQKLRVFNNLISIVKYHHFYHTIFNRINPACPDCIPRKGIIEDLVPREVQIIWSHFRGCLPHRSL